MPSGYWTGRISSLNDKFRNEALMSTIPDSHPMTDDTRRMRHVFGELAGFCKTPGAKKSLDEYTVAYWNKFGRQAPIPVNQMVASRVIGAGKSQEKKAMDRETLGKKEKKGVLGRLGLRRKSGI